MRELLVAFGDATAQRKRVSIRLKTVYETVRSTGRMRRFIVFGSFVSTKPDPNDVDVFLIMDNAFDVTQVTGEAALLFNHPVAQAHFGASIFRLRQLAATPNEEEAIRGWQRKRDGTNRGIVEIRED